MRSKVLFVALVVVVIAVTLLWRRHETAHPLSMGPQAESVEITPGSPRAPQVRRLAPDERKQLGEDIHAALRRAGPNTAEAAKSPAGGVGGKQPVLTDEPLLRLEEIGPSAKASLESTIPEFAKCYEGKSTANKAPIAIMEMVSDPDLGMVIDTTQMIDADGNPLPKDIDECLRETADSLSLPPLGKPGRLPIQYSFHFE